MAYQVAKRNGRLWITDGDEPVYTPPDFIRLHDRAPLRRLAESFEASGGRDIAAITVFEQSPRRPLAAEPPSDDGHQPGDRRIP